MKELILDLCADIFAHAELDYEITLHGNGTNASEASNVALELLDILRVKKSTIDVRIHSRIAQIEYE